MRLFFGLKPDPQTVLDIADWRERTLPPMERPVPTDNLHITLVFLGQVDPSRMEELLNFADETVSMPFDLMLNQLGYFSKSKILWIGPEVTGETILQLAKDLRKMTRRLGVKSNRGQYQPHLTIARRCQVPPPASILKPDFRLVFQHFALFESTNTRTGVRYRVLEEWTL